MNLYLARVQLGQLISIPKKVSPGWTVGSWRIHFQNGSFTWLAGYCWLSSSPCERSLGFLVTWWLASKIKYPKRSRRKLNHLLWPCLIQREGTRSHVSVGRMAKLDCNRKHVGCEILEWTFFGKYNRPHEKGYPVSFGRGWRGSLWRMSVGVRGLILK